MVGRYYPFGLTIVGISDMALKMNYTENKYKFIGQLYDDDLGWDTYQMKFRTMDPQLGRFLQIDPLSNKYPYVTNYAYAENRVINGIDLEGLEYFPPSTADAAAIASAFGSTLYTDKQINEIRVGEQKGLTQATKTAGPVVAIAAIGMADPAIGIPIAISYITGLPVTASPQAMEGPLASELTATDDAPVVASGGGATGGNIKANAAKGAEFEKTVQGDLEADGHTNIASQVTIKADNGTKTRMDFMSFNSDGTISLTEAKASQTAPLTPGQASAHPSIEQSGGTVVGKGKPGFKGGTRIPPTKVNVVRKI